MSESANRTKPGAVLAHRRRLRRAILAHPFFVLREVFAWWRYHRVWPWQLSLSKLAIIDPRPLAPEKLAALQEYVKARYPGA